MVEAHAQSVEDYLIEGLSYKLNAGASYVTKRRSCSFFSSGSDTYSPSSGVKVIRINLNGTDWCDPSTLRVTFDILNQGANAINFITGPHAFFSRMRILCNSVVVEDVNQYNRVCEMFSLLQSSDKLRNDGAEGLRKAIYETADSLQGTKKQTVSMKLCSGLFNQSKMLPLRYAPITIELELVGNAEDATHSAGNDSNWSLSNVQAKVDLVTLDNALSNSYDEHLLSGKSLPINFGTYISQDQVVSGSNLAVNISRAASRLKTIFVSLLGPGYTGGDTAKLKDFNTFWHPMLGSQDSDKELEAQVQIGSLMFPEQPIRSASEAYSQLVKAMGVGSSGYHGISIDAYSYRRYAHIMAFDLEKVLQSGFSGLSTRSGDLCTIKIKPVNEGTNYGTNDPSKIFTVIHTDNVLEIRDGGVTVFD